MTRIFVVYEIKGPTGFIPYIYTKSTIDEILMSSIKDNLDIEIFPNVEKILSKDILDGNKYNDNDIYLIPIEEKLEKYDLSEILTPSFLNFIKNKENFKIIFVNHGVETLYPLI